MEKIERGRLIAFEGIDGSGKSTQSRLLAERLASMGIPCYLTMEPTDSKIGSLIRQVLSGTLQMDSRAVAALFAADRLDHLLNETAGILKKIESGITVLTDRYYFSSYAYHSVDMPMDWVISLNGPSSAILKPDVHLFIDISPKKAMQRIKRGRQVVELYEKESRLSKVREQYLKAFAMLKESEHVVMLSGDRRQEETAGAVWEAVKIYFEKKHNQGITS